MAQAAAVVDTDLVIIRDVFGLSIEELAELFHRRGASVREWARRGIPKDMQASVERLAGLARVFDRELIRSRIPEIVRTPDAWLGGRSILATLRIDGVDPIYAYLGRLFGYREDP